jgi:hypothetical protein
MKGGIFLIQDDGELREMKEQKYRSEDLLQELLAKYPNLLAGDQIDNNSPRRWIFISRELGVPSEEEGSGRWSLDHLFLDQDGIPTLVEVKRSSDTRLRREVVGQMLDYAANAVAYWPVETIRNKFEANYEADKVDPETALTEILGADIDQEEFWQKVKTNLQAGRVRLVFVADEIPSELRRVVEFLNEQMDPAEVLGVEIAQFVTEGFRTLVPRVFGQKEKLVPPPRQWDGSSFFNELRNKRGSDEHDVAKKIFEWGQNNKLRIWWGKGRISGSFCPVIDHEGIDFPLVLVWTSGNVQIQFGVLKTRHPFDVESKRIELLHKFNEIPGISIPEDAFDRYPGLPLSILKEESVLRQFLETLDWFIQEIKSPR